MSKTREPKRNVYVGHRYVPKIMGEWDKQETYEGLSIVTNKGTSYTSKKRVPIGIDILDEEYWVVTGNYNAQVENYRQEVREFDSRINDNQLDIEKNKEQLTQKVYYSDTFKNIQIDNLSDGDMVVTKGFSEIDDKGNATYIIKNNSDHGHDVQLSNGLYAQPLFNGSINIKTLGKISEEDNSQLIQKAFDGAGDGETIYFPAGHYQTHQSLPSGKNVKYKGEKTNSLDYGTILQFIDCHGYQPVNEYNLIEDLYLRGSKGTQNIENYELGYIGIDLGGGRSNGGFTCRNIRVSGFNVGVAIHNEDSEIWSGAYHDFYNLYVQYNDVNTYFKNGVTHTKFHGGLNSRAVKHGIYSVNSYNALSHYTNAEFIGVTIESNGNPLGDSGGSGSRDLESKNIGIYAQNSTINLIGSYLENQFVFADVDGEINLTTTFIHRTVRMWSVDTGIIKTSQSLGDQSHVLRLRNDFNENNSLMVKSEGVSIYNKDSASYDTPYFRAVINGQANSPLFTTQNINRYQEVRVKDIQRIKQTVRFQVLSGDIKDNLMIDPRIYIRMSDNTMVSVNKYWIPQYVLKNIKNNVDTQFSFYWTPEFILEETDPEARVLDIFNRVYLTDNFTAVDYTDQTRLDILFKNLEIEVFTKHSVYTHQPPVEVEGD